MVNGLKVKTGPQFYLYEEGGISKVSDLLKSYGAKRVLVTHGTVSWEKALPKLVFLNDETIQFFYHRYSGECRTLLSHLTSNSNNTNTTFSKDAMTYVLTHRLLMFCTTLAEPKKPLPNIW
ncbi:hypothetical protein EfmGK961_12810 [Enterococcus faecium]|nr:hypothetical protein EfmGK961_12810 [Enterococcus faecium]